MSKYKGMMPMKNNKGISMITLIVTIVVMIIILGISYNLGSRYIAESKQKEREALLSVISGAVDRRQNDKYVANEADKEKLLYSGYHISSGDFEKLLPSFQDQTSIYEPGVWFILDADKAEGLGVVGGAEYLIDDLKKTAEEDDETQAKDSENKYLAVVDYFTGKVELIKYQDFDSEIVDKIKNSEECIHEYTVLSCTEPSVCKKCGEVVASITHDFDRDGDNKDDEATCTEDKKCNRCGYIEQGALGHDFLDEIGYNDVGHFNKCSRCDAMGNFEEHQKNYIVSASEWKHQIECSSEKCNWGKEEECSKQIRPKDTVEHTIYCADCLKAEDVEHDEKRYKSIDKKIHNVYCATCNIELYTEKHIDMVEPYGICDKCTGVLELTDEPEVESLTMENIQEGATNKNYAKYGDKLKVTLKTSVVLAEAPTIQLGNTIINSKASIDHADALTWIFEIKTDDYNFSDGVLNIRVTNIKSLWNIRGEDIEETTDGLYITYDKTKPTYIYQ